MFSRLAKLLLVATSFAPILITFAYERWLTGHFCPWGLLGVLVAGVLVLVCMLLLKGAKQQIAVAPITITALKTADAQIIAFVVAIM